MAKYPIFLELAGRRVVVIGAGAVALKMAQTLLSAKARLVVVSKNIDDMLTTLRHNTNVELVKSKYSKDYLAGAVLAIAATANPQLNRQIYKDCQQLEILCNVVDEPDLCDFITPAVIKRGSLQIAIGTEGHCPAYTGHLRKKLKQLFTDEHGKFLEELKRLRKRVVEDVTDAADRKAVLGKLVDDKSFDFFIKNGPAQWQKYTDKLISEAKQNLTPKNG